MKRLPAPPPNSHKQKDVFLGYHSIEHIWNWTPSDQSKPEETNESADC
jgi:hypothetical protein